MAFVLPNERHFCQDAAMEARISVTNVAKSYGTLKAVDGVSFSVCQGETFGFLGPNGAGKTTTMLMLAGLLKPDSGSVSIAGHDDPTRREVRRMIGLAPQSLALYEELTGRRNLEFFGGLHGLPRKLLAAKVESALHFSGLTDRADTPVSTWSGGMKRRLNLACAMVHDPPVLLLDEPMVGVDPQSRNHMFDSIEELKRQGRTILYTTHYMEEAARLCDRIGIIDGGRMLAVDTLDGLLSRWGGASRVVAEFRDGVPGVDWPEAVRNGNSISVSTQNPFETIAEMVRRGLHPSDLRVVRPDIEQVFLALTGRKLRD
jgi:ABC-2 type transport system ATP-binding protein